MRFFSRLIPVILACSLVTILPKASRAGQITWASNVASSNDAYGVYLMNDDGTNARAVVLPPQSGIFNCLFPSLSPTGDKIVFSGGVTTDNSYDIFVVNIDGTNLKKLTSGATNDSAPSWSPDGTQIVFSRRAASLGYEKSDIYLVNSNGTNLKLCANIDDDLYPDWSPNGQIIAFTSGSNIVTASGAPLVRNTSYSKISWSRDSWNFAYSPPGGGLYVAKPYGVTPTRVPNLGNSALVLNAQPSFTDQDSLVFVSTRDGSYDLYKVKSDGTETQRLTTSGTTDAVVKNIQPSWGPKAFNRFPTALNQTVNAIQNQPVNFSLMASDPDGDALNYTVLSVASHTPNNPANGVLSGVSPNLVYTPNANFSGKDSFSFNVNDSAAVSGMATVTFNVGFAPPVANDDNYTLAIVDKRSKRTLSVTAPGVLGNDTSANPLKKIALVGKPSAGSVTLRANGSFTFTPPKSVNSGIFSFTYRITDKKGASDTAVVSISVTYG